MNETGLESGNQDLVTVTTLPVVQDNATAAVWTSWDGEWRDVYVLDGENRVTAVYNLTTYDLADAANYAGLYDLFVAAREEGRGRRGAAAAPTNARTATAAPRSATVSDRSPLI